MQSEDGQGPNVVPSGGGGFEFGFDPNEDPELALALRVSMEEQRARQEAEGAAKPEGEDAAKPAGGETGAAGAPPASGTAAEDNSEEALLQRALAMSMETDEPAGGEKRAAATEEVNLAAMTEEEQIAYAMRMSMAGEI